MDRGKTTWVAPLVISLALGGCGSKTEGEEGGDASMAPRPTMTADDAGISSNDDENDASDSGASQQPMSEAPPPPFEPDVRLTLPAFAARDAIILPGVSAEVASCEATQAACNGVCLDTAGQNEAGCRLVALGENQIFQLIQTGETLFYTDGVGIQRVKTDGTDSKNLGHLTFAELVGFANDQLFVWAWPESGAGFSGFLVSTDTGEATQLVNDVDEPRYAKIVGSTLYYANDVDYRYYQMVRRTLPEGAAQPMFVVGELTASDTDGSWFVTAASTPDEESDRLSIFQTNGEGTTYGAIENFSATYFATIAEGYAQWVRGDGTYDRIKLGDTKVTSPVKLPFAPWAPYAHDSKYLYLTDYFDNAADRVYRMPLQGGDLTPIATFADGELVDLSASEGHLYAALGNRAQAAVIEITLP